MQFHNGKARNGTTETPAKGPFLLWSVILGSPAVPVVSQTTALQQPHPQLSEVIETVTLPESALEQCRPRAHGSRSSWQRFVAVRATGHQTQPLRPVLPANALVVIDRHYNSLSPYHSSAPTLYAAHAAGALVFRYVEFDSAHLILRPHNNEWPVILLPLQPGQHPSDLICGRICYIFAEL